MDRVWTEPAPGGLRRQRNLADSHPTPTPTTYVLTVNSAHPSSGVAITVTPSDTNKTGNGAPASPQL